MKPVLWERGERMDMRKKLAMAGLAAAVAATIGCGPCSDKYLIGSEYAPEYRHRTHVGIMSPARDSVPGQRIGNYRLVTAGELAELGLRPQEHLPYLRCN